MDLTPVTREEEFLQAILEQQQETNRLLRELAPAKPREEILEEPARPQHKGKR
ncbi:MAG: hypothetical protein M0Q92_02770 [Methanoregula sp.]|jgi:hypothetical protein|nr:hypothetical protein [Methanoregula sp.]